MQTDPRAIDAAVAAIETLAKRFEPERYLSLLAAFLAFAVTIYAAAKIAGLGTPVPDRQAFLQFFGGGGIVTAALFNISRTFDKALKLLEIVFKSGSGVQP